MRMIFIEVIVFSWLSIMLTSCTISFQNISTHGYANDLVDDEFKNDPDVKPSFTIPATVM